MNQKLKDLGFQSVKVESSKDYISIDQYGVISFSGKLRRELSIKKTESASIYFNPDGGTLAIHIGRFDRKKNSDMLILTIDADKTIRAKEELAAIEDEYVGYHLLPQGASTHSLEDVEIENVSLPPDPHSRTVLVSLKKDRMPFR